MQKKEAKINYFTKNIKASYAVNLFLGNGFDLSCGLKSKFEHFFYFKFPNKYSSFKSDNVVYSLLYACYYWEDTEIIGDCIPRYYEDDINWFDVESLLKFFSSSSYDNKPYYSIFYDFYLNHKATQYSSKGGRAAFISDVFSNKKIKYGKRNEDVINEIFDDDLSEFKKDFSDYLKSVINDDYFDEQTKLLNVIKERINLDEYDNIISFNYTPIKYECKHISNIHGKISKDNIVLGYGEYGTAYENDYSYIDSLNKEVQRTALSGDEYSPLLYDKENNGSVYIFYGLSLGRQDYQILFSFIEETFVLKESIFIYLYNRRFDDESIEGKKKNDKLMRINERNWHKFLRAFEETQGLYEKKTISEVMRLDGKVHFLPIKYSPYKKEE